MEAKDTAAAGLLLQLRTATASLRRCSACPVALARQLSRRLLGLALARAEEEQVALLVVAPGAVPREELACLLAGLLLLLLRLDHGRRAQHPLGDRRRRLLMALQAATQLQSRGLSTAPPHMQVPAQPFRSCLVLAQGPVPALPRSHLPCPQLDLHRSRLQRWRRAHRLLLLQSLGPLSCLLPLLCPHRLQLVQLRVRGALGHHSRTLLLLTHQELLLHQCRRLLQREAAQRLQAGDQGLWPARHQRSKREWHRQEPL